MRRALVVLAAIPSTIAACNGLLGIEDVAPPTTAGETDSGPLLDATSPIDVATPDALAFDVMSFDSALFDAPLLGDVVRNGPPCELANPASCGGPPRGCTYLDDAGVACATVGTSTTTCPQESDCAPGFFCLLSLGSSAPNTCVHWCRYGVPSDCDAGASCTSVNPTPTVSGTSYGYCS